MMADNFEITPGTGKNYSAREAGAFYQRIQGDYVYFYQSGGPRNVASGTPNYWDINIPLHSYRTLPNVFLEGGTADNPEVAEIVAVDMLYRPQLFDKTKVFNSERLFTSNIMIVFFTPYSGTNPFSYHPTNRVNVSASQVDNIQAIINLQPTTSEAVGGLFHYKMTENFGVGRSLISTESSDRSISFLLMTVGSDNSDRILFGGGNWGTLEAHNTNQLSFYSIVINRSLF